MRPWITLLVQLLLAGVVVGGTTWYVVDSVLHGEFAVSLLLLGVILVFLLHWSFTPSAEVLRKLGPGDPLLSRLNRVYIAGGEKKSVVLFLSAGSTLVHFLCWWVAWLLTK